MLELERGRGMGLVFGGSECALLLELWLLIESSGPRMCSDRLDFDAFHRPAAPGSDPGLEMSASEAGLGSIDHCPSS